MPYDLAYMWNLKTKINEQNNTETDSQIRGQTKLMVVSWEMGWGGAG